MNIKHFSSLILAFAICTACTPKPCTIIWTEGETDPATGEALHTMEILNAPAGTDWTVWFSQFRTPVTMEADAPGAIEYISGTLYRVVPAMGNLGGTMTLRYRARPLANQCRAPEGFHLQRRGKKPIPLETSYIFLPAEPVRIFDPAPAETGPYDMIPSGRVQPRRPGRQGTVRRRAGSGLVPHHPGRKRPDRSGRRGRCLLRLRDPGEPPARRKGR